MSTKYLSPNTPIYRLDLFVNDVRQRLPLFFWSEAEAEDHFQREIRPIHSQIRHQVIWYYYGDASSTY